MRRSTPRGVVQLGCELDASRSRADDHHAQLGRRVAGPIVGLEAGVDQAPVEAVGFGGDSSA